MRAAQKVGEPAARAPQSLARRAGVPLATRHTAAFDAWTAATTAGSLDMGIADTLLKMLRRSPEGRKLAAKDPRKLVKREEAELKREANSWKKELK